jgi:hypothetical protein
LIFETGVEQARRFAGRFLWRWWRASHRN